MVDAIDQEIQAIRTLLQALEPLSARARRSTLEYVLRRLEIDLGVQKEGTADAPRRGAVETKQVEDKKAAGESNAPLHVKTFKEQKKPKSDSEMAAVVAYYLAKLAPPDSRKDSISTEDIQTWFDIAEYPLPKEPKYTLQNAKKAGYFKMASVGQYSLNPVGLNLVAYSLPRAGAKESPKKRVTRTVSRPKKNKKK